MYATRQQSAQYGDENKKAEGKVAAKGATAVRAKVTGPVQRRALADVGNLVGAMSTRCNVSKENQERAFGTNKTNVNEKGQPLAAANGVVPEKWGSKGHRTSGTSAPASRVPTTAAPAPAGPAPPAPAVASNVAGMPLRSKVIVTRVTRAAMAKAAKEKEQSMTATLTACSEAACGGFDHEMMDAEDTPALVDIDAGDHGDVLQVIDYIEDIYAFYRRAESQSVVSPEYMLHQTDINDKMRGILLDWLVEVHLKFKLLPETLYLTCNLIDRFLAVTPVLRRNLQLVGVTAMLLASKYEEIWAPEVKDFVYISDNAYTKDQILAMEKLMLNTLKFNLTVPTPYVFTARFLKAAQTEKNSKAEMTAWYLLELALPEYGMLHYTPSMLAAAAVYSARRTLGVTPAWTPTLHRHSGFTESQLRMCAGLMLELQIASGKGNLVAVHKKYVSSRFGEVAKLPAAAPLPADGCNGDA
eukprot:jgi/Mesen1/4834/ME000243S04010